MYGTIVLVLKQANKVTLIVVVTDSPETEEQTTHRCRVQPSFRPAHSAICPLTPSTAAAFNS